MRTRAFLLISLAFLGGSRPALAESAEEVTYFVPLVGVLSQIIPGPQGPTYVYWTSSTGVFNNGPSPAMVHVKAAYGGGLWIASPPPCLNYQLRAGGGSSLGGCVFGPPGDGGNGFIEIDVEPSIVVTADIQRLLNVPNCVIGSIDGYGLISQGSAPLPVYRGFFSAESTVVAGPVDLGSFDGPGTCITGPATHRRRVNVTLFNGGTSEATFTVTAIPLRASSAPIYETHADVPPRDVRQLNAIPIPVSSDLPYEFGYDIRVWLRITATQPFLAYVSTIFEGGEPGTNAVTVYEAKTSN